MVIVASNGIRDSGLQFLESAKSKFLLLLDGARHFYRQLGLKRSIKAVWSVATLKSYAEEKVADVPPTPALPGDDLHVMGGDFIVDVEGKFVFAYASRTSSDRPAVDKLLQELGSLN